LSPAFEITALLVTVVVLGWLLTKTHNAILHMAKTQAELAAEIRAFNEQTRKGINEIKAKIAHLEETIVNAPVSADVEEAVAALKATVQEVDDIVPDAPAPEGGTPA
jgi:methyl-accepting chemotaxis protein